MFFRQTVRTRRTVASLTAVAHNPATMLVQVRALSARWGRLALWLMPMTIVYEWVGGTFYKSLPVRIAYLSLFLSLFWLAPLTPAVAWPPGRARRVCGLLLAVGGASLLGCSVWWSFGARLGLSPFEPPAWLAHEPHRLLLPICAAWPLAVGASWLREARVSARTYEQLGCFVALAFVLHIAAGVRVQSLSVLSLDENLWLLLALGALLLALALLPQGSARVRLSLIVAAGFLLRVRGIATWVVDPRVRDMLALVESAQDSFAAGHDPYAFYAMQHGSELPLTYFPGLWLGYGVPRLVGLDLRFMGALLEACFLFVLSWLARRNEGELRAWAEAFVGCFAAVWLFSPSVQWNVIYAEPALWWGLLGLLFALTFSGRFAVAALLLGYAVATRHFAIVLAPFVLLYFVRVRGYRGALPYVAIASSVALLLLTPFVLADPELFWFGTFRWLREYGPAHLPWFFDRFGFMQQFHEQGLIERLPLIQGLVVLLCFAGAVFSRNVARISSYAATALLLFIMLNVLLWDSFLLDGAIAAAGVIIARPLSVAAPRPWRPPSLRVLRASQAALAIVAIVGSYLAFTLVRTLHPPGRTAAHDFMVASVRKGDFVIDRSDRRVAFVEGSWLLRRDEVPAPIGGALYDAAWGGGHALNAPGRVWLVTQESRDGALRSSFAQLGKQVASRALGSFHVQAIEPRRATAAVPLALPQAAHGRRCQVGWTDADMLGVLVSRERPSVITFAQREQQAATLLAAGFPNGDVVWPRKGVQVRVLDEPAEPPFELQNLSGMQWQARAHQPHEALRLELRTDDPLPRLVCLELLWLSGV
ncbi:MAG: putative rane protein [Myxococcaceae bacterium]|nr:putative rane protein [Myxococcaceae bacterium]